MELQLNRNDKSYNDTRTKVLNPFAFRTGQLARWWRAQVLWMVVS